MIKFSLARYFLSSLALALPTLGKATTVVALLMLVGLAVSGMEGA